MPEPAQPGRARVWERAVVERHRARRRVWGEVIGLRMLVKCYRIFCCGGGGVLLGFL